MLKILIETAMQVKDAKEPTRLLELANTVSNALEALNDESCKNEWMRILERDFGFSPPRDRGNLNTWAPLLAWALKVIETWSVADDPNEIRLAAAFLVISACNVEGKIWDSLPDAMKCSSDVIGLMGRLLSRSSVNINALSNSDRWEREQIIALQTAEADSDWVKIDHIYPQFQSTLWLSLPIYHAANCLARFDFPELVLAVGRIKGFLTMHAVMDALAREQKLLLGRQLSNKAGRFASVYCSMSRMKATTCLSDLEQEAVTELMSSTASDLKEWEKWMAVFNTYPLRYPALQRPLGKALASLPDEAISIYISSISLYPLHPPYNGSRGFVADCLTTFAEEADERVRKALWTKAFDRWAQWSFNSVDQSKYLFQVSGSELDFAVVGYYVECVNESERQRVIDECLSRVEQVGLIWFESVSAYDTAVFKALSELQLCCRAQEAGMSKVDWLKSSIFMPAWKEGQRYRYIRASLIDTVG
ncbi:hypothetical protein SAMN03159488_04517 [Pseudomonas sp. NFIX10]|uniref:hypothetical protein n=1 Tax=unclassified Pseudomonas TaxID=196821 RepID=UPI0008E4A49C|nr:MULTISPECIES: hypothetical protein [unclassified Pseudomonas]SFB50375.1 hypothetical protein SAMN03159488_04517 [Pseudomonas sp. NFIX10]SFF31915.1 hypothetical protein SAMN03159367_03965 [Pseudomonas sp. NFACC06-1]